MTSFDDVVSRVQDCIEMKTGSRPNKENARQIYWAVSYAIESCLLSGLNVRVPGVGTFYRDMTRAGHFGRKEDEYKSVPTVRCHVSETLRKKVKLGDHEDAY